MSRDGPSAGPADAPGLPDDAVEVGRVVGAWGVKGGIKVKPFARDPQALFSSKRWFLRAPVGAPQAPRGRGGRSATPAQPPAAAGPGGTIGPSAATATPSPPSPPLPTLLRVRTAREHGDAIVALCEDLEDRDAAERLAGARVFVARSSFPTPAADEFYWVDLIGLAVRNREGRTLGTISGLLDNGPQCVLCVQPEDEGQAEVLIPFVAHYVYDVDLAARCVHVDWQPDY